MDQGWAGGLEMEELRPVHPDAAALQALQAFAVDLVLDAGKLALSLQTHARARQKSDRTWVTEADFLVQALIRERIALQFPAHAFLGEEEVSTLKEGELPAALWIVDPIDGTDSYRRQLPTWSICIGLALEGKPSLGVVYMPSTGELFAASLPGEAARNGRAVSVATEETLDEDSTLLVPSQLHLHTDVTFPGKLRSYGSTASHICYVAAGAASAAVFAFAHPWDVFAAGVVLQAAGGAFYKPDGTTLDLALLALERTPTPVLVATSEALAAPVYRSIRLRSRTRAQS